MSADASDPVADKADPISAISQEPQLDSKKSSDSVTSAISQERQPVQIQQTQKKTPQIKPFNLRNLKSTIYDSATQLNKGFDPSHKIESYAHGVHSKVMLDQAQKSIPSQALRKKINQRGAAKTSKISEKPLPTKTGDDNVVEPTKEDPAKAILKVKKKSPLIKPFNMRNLKSPTYDSSTQLSKAFDGDHELGHYQHGKKDKVPLAWSVGEQMMRRNVNQRQTGGGVVSKTKSSPILSVNSSKSKPMATKQEEEEVEAKKSDPPSIDPAAKLRPKPKLPFSLKNLKSPTYDSSTLLNQAFDPNHRFEDYAHGVTDKVALNTQQPMSGAMEVKALRTQITSRSSAGSPSSPFSDSSAGDVLDNFPLQQDSDTASDFNTTPPASTKTPSDS